MVGVETLGCPLQALAFEHEALGKDPGGERFLKRFRIGGGRLLASSSRRKSSKPRENGLLSVWVFMTVWCHVLRGYEGRPEDSLPFGEVDGMFAHV